VSKAPEHLSQQELESYLWGAANILNGMIDAADFKQYIFPLLFFKRISDVWDEEYQTALKESSNDLDYAEFCENHRSKYQKTAIGKMFARRRLMLVLHFNKLLTELKKSILKCCTMYSAMPSGRISAA
jgi:type I restriction-modification system DNA methylase subunit